MPELPEVETVVRDLRSLLVGRRLVSVRRVSGQELRRPWRAEWETRLTGRRVEALSRRGKWIVGGLDDGAVLLVHLGMTGQLTVAAGPLASHVHFLFPLDDEGELRYRDVRRFGSVEWLANEAVLEDFFRSMGLGPEPFGVPAALWRERLENTSRCLKAVLLDQSVVAGVGNIYADEALFQAQLHPTRRADSLSAAEAERLRKAIEAVLTRAIEQRGSTIRDYIGGSGLRGGYQDEFEAYGRTGEPCRRCRGRIECLRVAGRSSHFCPQCQMG